MSRRRLFKVACLEMVFLFAALDAGEIEDVVDETGEAGGFGGDDAEIGTLFDWIVDAAFGEQFREHADRGERSFQFVRDVADEIGFLPREGQLTIQVGDDEPAADADGEHEQRDDERRG